MSLIELSDKERRLAGKVDTGIADALAISSEAGGLRFVNSGEVMEFAKMMALAHVGVRKHLRGNPGACLAICVQAVEWGMSPFAVANKSYAVNDQIAFESQLIQAVILRRAPIKGRLKVKYAGEGEDRVCTVWAELRDQPGEIVEYESPKFSKIQPKNSPLWKTDPDQQHFYYSGRALCRRHFPDVLLGVYTEDELPHRPDPGPSGARDVTPTRRTLADKMDALAATSSRVEVEDGSASEARSNAAAPESAAPEATSDPSPPATDLPPEDKTDEPFPGDDSRDELLSRLMPLALEGTQKWSRHRGQITEKEKKLLQPGDLERLNDAAAKVDAPAARQGQEA